MTRLALGLSPTPVAGWLLLVLGVAFGPHGLGVLSDPVLVAIDPAVSAALAGLGVIVGLDLNLRRPFEIRLATGAGLEAAITMLTVAAGVLAVDMAFSVSGGPAWLLAALLGVCAAPSATTGAPSDSPSPASRVGDLDDLLPILVGMAVLVTVQKPSTGAAAALLGQAGAIALVIAAAIWLLVTATSSGSEQRVFVIGAILLLGGAAAQLSLSALFAGLVAGVFWNAVGGPVREQVSRDMRYLQHPLVALLFVVAGARLELSGDVAALALAAAYVLCRAVGKAIGAAAARRTVVGSLPRGYGWSLLSPGVVGRAFALNLLQVSGEVARASTLFAIVLVGSLVSEGLALSARGSEPA